MSKLAVNVNHVPNYTEYFISRRDLYRLLHDSGIFNNIDFVFNNIDLLWDSNFYYVRPTDWNEILIDVSKNMPKYTADKFDCENFALLTVARITEKYKLNGCGIAIGESPLGRHGWNIFVAYPPELFYFEPQTGQIMELKGEGYQAEYVVWG